MVDTTPRGRQPASPEPATRELALPGAGLDAARMPGHWLLARLGKRVLRPGGVELTRWMLDALAVGPGDRVVELAAGLGATARLTLARHPASYVGVDRDSAALAALSTLDSAITTVRGHRADAARTGLPDGCATVVYGEAMLTMQPEPAKRRVVREAHRLLGPSGRYAIHELCVVPDEPASWASSTIRRPRRSRACRPARTWATSTSRSRTSPRRSRSTATCSASS